MSKKILLMPFVLSAVLVLQMAGWCFADAQSQFDTAEQYYDLKEYAKAEQVYRTVLDNWPDADCAIWAQTGIAKSRVCLAGISLGSLEDANTAVGKLIANFAQNPELAIAVFTVADEYREIRKYDKANPLYQYVVDNFSIIEQPSRSQILAVIMSNVALDKSDAARAAVEKLIDRFSGDPKIGEAVYRIAEEYYGLADFKKAIEYYQLILDNWPESEYAIWGQEGVVLSNICLDNLHGAQTAIEKLVADFNNNSALPEALYGIARRFDDSRKYEQAAGVYQQIIQQYPNSSYADKANLEVAKFEIWPYIQAQGDTNTLAAVDQFITDFNTQSYLPKDIFQTGENYYIKALEYYNEGHDEQVKEYFQKALDLWERIIQQFPSSTVTADAYYFSADSYQRLGEYEKAIECCQNLLANWPNSNHAMRCQVGIAKLNALLGNDAAAQAAIERSIDRFSDHPGLPMAIFRIGGEYYIKACHKEIKGSVTEAKDYFEKALAVLEKIIKEFPSSDTTAHAHYLGADCYRRLGQYQKALEYYQEIVVNWPDCGFVEHVKSLISRLEKTTFKL
jgi:TolA-binding protein